MTSKTSDGRAPEAAGEVHASGSAADAAAIEAAEQRVSGPAAAVEAGVERDAAAMEAAERRAPQPSSAPVAAPLLAVAGLCGGAGASTLAFLAARHAARAGERPVLVADTGGPSGGLAACARVAVARSLPRAAAAIAAHEPLGAGLFADAGDGLRVMASAPEPPVDVAAAAAARVLKDARGAHRLTVVDCGLPGGALEQQVLETATHLAWVLPATLGGARRARRTLELFAPRTDRREVVVARHDAAGATVPLSLLKELAASRRAPLLLVPHIPDLAEQPPEAALELAGEALDALVAEALR
jgi:Flp pilus assembly CpaE family ATPase